MAAAAAAAASSNRNQEKVRTGRSDGMGSIGMAGRLNEGIPELKGSL